MTGLTCASGAELGAGLAAKLILLSKIIYELIPYSYTSF